MNQAAPKRAGNTPAVTADQVVFVTLLVTPIALTLRDLHYYSLGPGGRIRDPLHATLSPGRPLGLLFGFLGLFLFLFMWLYPMRKRIPILRKIGGLGTWLRIHVIVGSALPLLVAVHAGWRFHGLIGLGYAAMVLVSLSGIVGRYLYTRIPRHRNGVELTRDEVEGERRTLLTRIAAQTGLDPTEVERALFVEPARAGRLGPIQVLARLLADDIAQRRALGEIRRRWSMPRPGAPAPDPKALREALRLARRQIALDQQMRMLDATHRLFGYWHVAHLPVAITALIAVLVHVVVAVIVGGVKIG